LMIAGSVHPDDVSKKRLLAHSQCFAVLPLKRTYRHRTAWYSVDHLHP
jgi:hypothetical protein